MPGSLHIGGQKGIIFLKKPTTGNYIKKNMFLKKSTTDGPLKKYFFRQSSSVVEQTKYF